MSGVDKIIANLEHLGGDIGDAMEKVVLREAKRIQADAKRLAPVETGRLRGSITAGVERDADGDIVGTVGTNADYAAYVEFGTGPVGEASPKVLPPGASPAYRKDGWTYKDVKTGEFRHTKGQPAQPFLYPAFKANEASVKENIAKAVRDSLKGGGGDG